jgi:hypothetical protein
MCFRSRLPRCVRDRVEDIPRLVWEFVDEFSQLFGRQIEAVSKASMNQLQEHRDPEGPKGFGDTSIRCKVVKAASK